MRYADRFCEVVSKGDCYVVTGRDVFSGNPVQVKIPAPDLFAYRQGAMIQDAMPTLSASEREFLISGMYDSFPDDWAEGEGTDDDLEVHEGMQKVRSDTYE